MLEINGQNNRYGLGIVTRPSLMCFCQGITGSLAHQNTVVTRKYCCKRPTGVLYFCSPFVRSPIRIPCIANVGRKPARLWRGTNFKENLHRMISLKDSRN